VEKQCRTEQATNDRHYGTFTLNAGYRKLQIHTLRLCNIHYYYAATIVARTPLDVTLYIHCLSSCYLACDIVIYARQCIGHMPIANLPVLENGQSCRRPCLTGAESFTFKQGLTRLLTTVVESLVSIIST
jgi:hypothetical protein